MLAVDGARLKALRESLALSQAELAEMAAVSARTVRDLERGNYETAQPRTVRRLATALGVAPADLIGK